MLQQDTMQNKEISRSAAPSLVPEDEQTIAGNHGGTEAPQLSRAKAVTLVAGATLGMISNVAGSAIGISIPTIGRELKIPADQLQWPVAAYSLTAGCFLLLFGRLADLYGRRNAFLLGIIWFCIWTIAGGFAQTPAQLSVFRAMQGMGSAATVPASVGILASSFAPGRARSIAFATFSCGAPMGGSVAFLIGGTLTQLSPYTWRSFFFVNAALSALAGIALFFAVAKDKIDAGIDRRVDWIGAALITSSLVLLTVVLSEGETRGWGSPMIITLLILSAIGIAAFLTWEHYLETQTTRPPLMRLTLWKRASGRFAAVQAVGFFEWIAFTSWGYWVVLYYQQYLRLSPVKTMIRMIPMFVSGATCNLVFALVVGKVSGAILLGVGAGATGIACLLFAVIITDQPYWAFGFPAAILTVFGADFVFATGSLFVAKVALPHEQSLAGGVFNTLMQLGTAVGLALTSVVANRTTQLRAKQLGLSFDPDAPDSAPLEALLYGYRSAQWTGFAFAMVSVALIVVFLRGIGKVGSIKVKAESEADDEEKRSVPEQQGVSGSVEPLPAQKDIQN